MAEHIREWAEAGFLNLVGGCCGTTPEHIAAMARAVEGCQPRALPEIPVACRLAGLEPLTISPESMFVNVGERRWPLALAALAALTAILALAGPTWDRLPVPAFRSDEALVVVGALVAVIGLAWVFLPPIPWLGRLPGDT